MTKQFLIVNGESLPGNEKKYNMIKTYSFTTDDDDGGSVVNFQTISNHDKLLSVNSPSIDSNNIDDDLSESSRTLTKRKSRRQIQLEMQSENKRSSIKKHPWYQKIDLLTPLMVIGMLIVLYLMWVKRDVWIQRLLTSNNRYITVKNEQTEVESTDSPTITTTISSEDSTSDSSHNEDIIENTEEKNDGDSTGSTKSSSGQKINIRVRRNKIRFDKERPKKKRDSSVDDDKEEETKPFKETEPILPSSSTHSTKKHQHQSVIRNENFKNSSPLNSSFRLSTHNDIIEQIRKNLKSQSRNRNFLSTLSKRTGLNKNKLYRFIYKKDYQFMTLRTFISLLNSFNLMILIVPK